MGRTLQIRRLRKPKRVAPVTLTGVLYFVALAYVVTVASYVLASYGWDDTELMLATERGYFTTDDGRVFTVRPSPD